MVCLCFQINKKNSFEKLSLTDLILRFQDSHQALDFQERVE